MSTPKLECQLNLSWFPIKTICPDNSGRVFWAIRHDDQHDVLSFRPEDWEHLYPGLSSPINAWNGFLKESFTAFIMTEELHTQLIPHPNTVSHPWMWAVFFVARPRWPIATAMIKKFSCGCVCRDDAADVRTHIM